MTNPNINTLTDIFLPEGYGAFGFGDGGYGGASELLNPQWNTNSGIYGIDPVSGLAYVEATSTPSYVGASIYDIEYSSFFAKISPVITGISSTQTAIVIKQNAHNYVEMSLGPDNIFRAYVSNNSNVVLSSTVFPTYDPVAHAYWRIRNDARLTFRFDTSPDGFTWTERGSAPYEWDASGVVVTIFAGFTGLDSPGNIALISSINLPGNTLQLSSIGRATSSASGMATVTDANSLSATVNASAVSRGSFKAFLAIPQGGITDIAYSPVKQAVDPLIATTWSTQQLRNTVTVQGTNVPFTWATGTWPWTVPSAYRDGSYWQPAAYSSVRYTISNSPNTSPTFMRQVQYEETSGLNNLLSENAFVYTNSCPYAPTAAFGTDTVVKTSQASYTGQYSAKIISNNTPVTTGSGGKAYFPLPERSAIVPISTDPFFGNETTFATIYLSTQRAGTQWTAGFIFYDASFNIIADSTYQQATYPGLQTHPGSGIWQASTISFTSSTTAKFVAVVPVVFNPSSLVETVYMSNNTLNSGNLSISEVQTAYSDPRTAQVNVKADRVNYVRNAGFNTGTTEWVQLNVGTSGTPNPATLSWDNVSGYKSLGSLRIDVAALSGTFAGITGATLGAATRSTFASTSTGRQPVVQGLKPGHTYTISAWINQGPNCPDVYMNFNDGNGLGMNGVSINNTKMVSPDNIEGNWTRMQVTYTVPPTGLEDYSFYFYTKFVDITHAPYSFWVDSLLVEETTTYNGYFDGGFATADYRYEFANNTNMSRSYYYKDFTNKVNNLNKLMKSVLPVGESYNLKFNRPIS